MGFRQSLSKLVKAIRGYDSNAGVHRKWEWNNTNNEWDVEDNTGTMNQLQTAFNASGSAPVMAKKTQDPILHLPLLSNTSFVKGNGYQKFGRWYDGEQIGYKDPHTGMLVYHTVNEPVFEKDGLMLEPATQNRIRYHRNFNTDPWTIERATITLDNATAPDGTTTATTLTEDTQAGLHRVFCLCEGNGATYYTASIFVKRNTGTRNFHVNMWDTAAVVTFAQAEVDLSDGSIIGTPTGEVYVEYFEGTGYYRISLTGLATNGSTTVAGTYIMHNGSAISYTGDGTSSVDVWGAQLTITNRPTSYIPESRQRLFWTDTFSNTTSTQNYSKPWIHTRSSVSGNVVADPLWGLSSNIADKIVEDSTANNNHYIHQVVDYESVEQGYAVYTISIYAKAAGRDFISIEGTKLNNDWHWATFDLKHGMVDSWSGYTISAEMSDVGNGWYRCSSTVDMNVGTTDPWVLFALHERTVYDTPAVRYDGDGTSGVYVFGAQMEKGYRASYYKQVYWLENYIDHIRYQIPLENNFPFETNQYTLCFDYTAPNWEQASQWYCMFELDGVTYNRFEIWTNGQYGYYNGEPYAASAWNTIDHEVKNRVVIVVDGKTSKVFVNGANPVTITSTYEPAGTPTHLTFGAVDDGFQKVAKANVSNIRLYDKVFTDDEAKQL